MNQNYLISESPMKALTVFAMPMIVGNLFQQVYTMVDSAVVGRYVGAQAIAAVGASYSLTNIFICVAVGGGIGASVVVSKYFGAQQYQKMKLATYTAFSSFLVLSLILAAAGLVGSRQIMMWLNTPEDVLDLSAVYLKIYFLGLPFLFMYNVLSSMFNALGKSRIPLAFLIFSSLLNIVLDLYMVTVLDMGVAGVAWATLIAQGISAVLSFIVYMVHQKQYMTEQLEHFFSVSEMAGMTKIAIPSILQQSIVSIGMMLVQSVVNSFGTEALAGFSAAMRIESFCVVPMAGIGNAVSSYTAQNLGAGKEERIPQGLCAALKLVVIFAAAIFVMLVGLNGPIIAGFLGTHASQTATVTGQNFLKFMGCFFALIGFKMSVDGILRGAGDMKMFTVASLLNLFIRVTFSIVMAPRFGIAMVWVAVPLGWLANGVISMRQYLTGKWRESSV